VLRVRATVRPGQRRLAWAVLDNPALLTGAGTYAPAPAVLRFIDELIAAGAGNITQLSCPRCQRTVALSKQLDGQRICRNCFARERAASALPERDERLVKLERWTAATLAARANPDGRRVFHGYAIWHHLRRLRQRLGRARASHLQCLNVRSHITAAVNLPAEGHHHGGCPAGILSSPRSNVTPMVGSRGLSPAR
jgi:hypothetical protein